MEASYEDKAVVYAESYGIVTYHLENNLLIYYQNYREPEVINHRIIDNVATYKRIVDLNTYATISERMKELVAEGWDNV